jgi:cell division protein FtsQ
MPPDVRLMNAAAVVSAAIGAALLLASALVWLGRSPAFALRAIDLEGDLQRNSVAMLRANVMPRLSGNFFSVDVERVRTAFEAVPWVRHASVRRVWPDRLVVRLEEHEPVALWRSRPLDGDRLVNGFGEVFEANLGDVEEDALPLLEGPQGSAQRMLILLRRVQPLLAWQDLRIDSLHLSARGAWRATLDGEVAIELGRGSEDEVMARVDRFARTLGQVTAHFGAPLLAADLRHPDSYAVRLRNVSTAAADTAPPRRP